MEADITPEVMAALVRVGVPKVTACTHLVSWPRRGRTASLLPLREKARGSADEGWPLAPCLWLPLIWPAGRPSPARGEGLHERRARHSTSTK
jgi:hypothetical protein